MEKQAIVLKQKPVIVYDLIESIGMDVSEKINSLNLSEIAPTEDNLKVLKKTRTELKKEFELFEGQRKMVKDMIMKPYNDFETKYKDHISNLFKDADIELKEKINIVENDILSNKINALKEYFDSVNTFDFVSFDDVGLKVIKSASDKKLKEDIHEYLQSVKNDINTIRTLPNSDRVLAKYQISKNLNDSISQTNIEIQREEQIRKQKSELNEVNNIPKKEVDTANNEEHVQKLVKAKFTVTTTIENIKKLKEFMKNKGIRYE